MNSGLVFKKDIGLSIFAKRCPNNHLHIFGGYSQVDWVVDPDSMTATGKAPCYECGCEVTIKQPLKWSRELVCDGAGI